MVELWISYNQIEKLKGISVLKKLKVIIDSFTVLSTASIYSNCNSKYHECTIGNFIDANGQPFAWKKRLL